MYKATIIIIFTILCTPISAIAQFYYVTQIINGERPAMHKGVMLYDASMDGKREVFEKVITDAEPRCLTKHILAKGHKGNVATLPGDDLIYFFVAGRTHNPEIDYLSLPDYGFGCDIWFYRKGVFKRLAYGAIAGNGGNSNFAVGSFGPVTSRDGKKVGWSICMNGTDVFKPKKPADPNLNWELSNWHIIVGNLDGWTQYGWPSFKGMNTYSTENVGIHELCDFSPDGKSMLVMARSGKNSDIYKIDLDSGKTTNLTRTPKDKDRFARYTSDGKEIIYISGKDVPGSEFWRMDHRGKYKKKLTKFNDKNNLESLGAESYTCRDWSWFDETEKSILFSGCTTRDNCTINKLELLTALEFGLRKANELRQ